MPSPNKKKRRLIDDTDSPTPPPSSAAWRRTPDKQVSDWEKVLQGVSTPNNSATSTFISATHSPFAPTPSESKDNEVETKTDTPQVDNDGFAIPTPGLSTLRSTGNNSTLAASTTNGLIEVPASTIPPNPLSTLISTSIKDTPAASVVPQSTRQLTPFTPSSGELRDVPPIDLNFRKLIITAYQVYEEETLLKLEDKNVKTHINSMLDGMKQKTGARGDKLVIMLKELLDYIPKTYKGWQRSAMQKNFHRNFMQAVCLHLYRDDPDIDMGKIMKMNQFDNLKQQVLCLTPRRFGKTTSVAMFVAAYCLTVPRSEQCIFSTGRRASQKLLELIRDMILSGKHREMFIKCNQETLMCRGENNLDIRKVHSYPSCAKTLRGTGGDVIYLEEAAVSKILTCHNCLLY